MADLDDFFAKKDKKKGKAKKFVTAEEIAKQLDDTSKKVVESKMKLRPVDSGDGKNDSNEPEDEWRVVEETKKDYSGLKLAQLTIDDESNHNDSENAGDPNDPSYDGEGREGEERDPSKPWKLDAANAAKKEKAAPAPEAPATTSNIYISPAMKSLMAKQKQKKGIAPDLKSEEYFPTLGQEKPAEAPKPPKLDPSFEEVKHGVRAKTVEQSSSSQISIGNRYNSLNNDAS
uniref:Protein CDV3 homolog n=1 Tax=Anopheles christyi TaxID=43041 RepID=A0A182K6D2_9DIPT